MITFDRLHLYKNHKKELTARTTFIVDGLGIVEIENTFSEELIKQIQAEAMVAIKMKLGQKLD